MNARPIGYASDTGLVPVGWQCAECGRAWMDSVFDSVDPPVGAKRFADECCAPEVCACGRPKADGWTVCHVCRRESEIKKERALYDKAKKVTLSEYTGDWVFSSTNCHFGDEGFLAVTEVDLDDEDTPDWVWGCYPEQASGDIDEWIREHVLGEHHENAADHVDAGLVEAMQKILNVALEECVTYRQDTSVVVILRPEST